MSQHLHHDQLKSVERGLVQAVLLFLEYKESKVSEKTMGVRSCKFRINVNHKILYLLFFNAISDVQ